MINQRIQRLRALMRERNMDAYLVPTSDYHQSEYVGEYFKCRQFMTGFTGSAGTLAVTADQACMWTDGRYFVQAEKQLDGTGVRLMRMGAEGVPTVTEFIRDVLPEGGVLGFDGRVVDGAFGGELAELLEKKGGRAADGEDLVDMIWTDRPPLSKEPVWVLEETYAGVPASEKIRNLRRAMDEAGAGVHILTALDEIAWLLNLRGNDTPCTPVFLAFAVITAGTFHLYVNPEAVAGKTAEYLAMNHVTVRPYLSVFEDVRSINGETVLLERQKVNCGILSALDGSNRIMDRMNPCVMMKAVKNSVEIENIRRVHLRDGLAVTRFMYWLKTSAGKVSMDELSVASKLEEFRREQEGYLGPSFVTIAAYGDNAAMCHYRASAEQNREISPRGLLLVDSGGQYMGGTTDITRTFAMGPLTAMEREYFTIVAMAMLKVMDMKFLHGCSGINLDYTIRQALWRRGLDFNHGTGHGVGYMNGCHERPNGIRWKVVPERQDSAVIEPGMVCSDEPGLYIEGVMGTRTENLILCVPSEKNQFGQFLAFEFLTFAPIDLDAIDPRFMSGGDIRRLNQYHSMVRQKLEPLLEGDELEWLRRATRPVEA